ncbi:DUF1599 domain-containing protein [Lewinella lacunae]|uniref:DUF1599 domain-containing protein n=2 Tax=Neolewinella lacunae TaxID=1517758 RepID=A0A923TEG1_9BACT|nr:DUF1599 domain-containing protein [Neolewinella lacunae]
MTKESIQKITDKLTETLVRKNQDYGGASFDLGMQGNFVHIYDKVSRLRSLVWNKNSPNFESVEDSLMDLMGYCIIGLHILEQENTSSDEQKIE